VHGGPAVYLALPRLQKGHQAFQQHGLEQREHGLRLQAAFFQRAGHGDVGVFAHQGFAQARHQVGGEVG
jgi:hypothetical protein